MDRFNGGVRQLIGAMLHCKNVLLASMRRTARTIFIAGDVALTIQDTWTLLQLCAKQLKDGSVAIVTGAEESGSTCASSLAYKKLKTSHQRFFRQRIFFRCRQSLPQCLVRQRMFLQSSHSFRHRLFCERSHHHQPLHPKRLFTFS